MEDATDLVEVTTNLGLPRWYNGKNKSSANAGNTRDTGLKYVGSIPGSRRSSRVGNSNSLECSCLEKPMDRGASWATQSMELQKVRHDRASACLSQTYTVLDIMRAATFDIIIKYVARESLIYNTLYMHSIIKMFKEITYVCSVAISLSVFYQR